MGVQPFQLITMLGETPLVRSEASRDFLPPHSHIVHPAAGTTHTPLRLSSTLSRSINISGIAADVGGGVVAGVEVSLDGGLTWSIAKGQESWFYLYSPLVLQRCARGENYKSTKAISSAGEKQILVIKSRAVDDSGWIEGMPGKHGSSSSPPTSWVNTITVYLELG